MVLPFQIIYTRAAPVVTWRTVWLYSTLCLFRQRIVLLSGPPPTCQGPMAALSMCHWNKVKTKRKHDNVNVKRQHKSLRYPVKLVPNTTVFSSKTELFFSFLKCFLSGCQLEQLQQRLLLENPWIPVWLCVCNEYRDETDTWMSGREGCSLHSVTKCRRCPQTTSNTNVDIHSHDQKKLQNLSCSTFLEQQIAFKRTRWS